MYLQKWYNKAMSSETSPLPQFRTERGRLLDIPDQLPDLRYGFVLNEVANGVSDRLLHFGHCGAAQELAALSGMCGDSMIFPEYLGIMKGGGTPRHVDGLRYRYLQVNSSHAQRRGPNGSHVRLSVYMPQQDVHDYLAGVADGVSFEETMLETVFPDGDVTGTYPYAFADLLPPVPGAVFEARVEPGMSVAFPNGYPAQRDVSPEELVLHEFQGTNPDQVFRTISTSAVVPVAGTSVPM